MECKVVRYINYLPTVSFLSFVGGYFLYKVFGDVEYFYNIFFIIPFVTTFLTIGLLANGFLLIPILVVLLIYLVAHGKRDKISVPGIISGVLYLSILMGIIIIP